MRVLLLMLFFAYCVHSKKHTHAHKRSSSSSSSSSSSIVTSAVTDIKDSTAIKATIRYRKHGIPHHNNNGNHDNKDHYVKRNQIARETDDDYEETEDSSGEGSGSGGWDLSNITDNKEELKLFTTIEKLSEQAKGKKHHHKSNSEGEGTKVCYRRCSYPLSFKECAIPRCARKGMLATRNLCYWLCRHQKKTCEKVCV